jgi:aryl-alcohol dehydrogenase-like predicted oxidoreductase
MIRSIEASLKRLKIDRIDLYWAHFADGMTPMEEIIRAFDDLMRAGKIHYAGLSNFPAWRISRGDLLAEMRGWGPIAGIQVEYSLAQRTAERELLPMAEALGLGAALWSPLGGGFLSGKYRSSDEGRINSFLGRLVHKENTARETAILDALSAIAKEVDRSATEVALAWLLYKACLSTTALIPILGPRTYEQLLGSLGALEVNLSQEQIGRLDETSQIAFGTPHEQTHGSAAAIAGGKPELLRPRVIPVA